MRSRELPREIRLLGLDSLTPTEMTPQWFLWTSKCLMRTTIGGAGTGGGPPTRMGGRSSISEHSTSRKFIKRGMTGASSSSSTKAVNPVTELSCSDKLKWVKLASIHASVAAATASLSEPLRSTRSGQKSIFCSIRTRSGCTFVADCRSVLIWTSRQPRLLEANFDYPIEKNY